LNARIWPPSKPRVRWITDQRRLRIYERDHWTCLWCGWQAPVGSRGLLSLDHFIPRSRGGDHSAFNLLTACRECNEERRSLGAIEYAELICADFDGHVDAHAVDALIGGILSAMVRPLPEKHHDHQQTLTAREPP